MKLVNPDPAQALDALRDAVAEAPPEALPGLVGALGGLVAVASARMVASRAPEVESADRALTVAEAAERLGVSESWIRHRARRLPFIVRLGRSVRVSSRALDRYLKARVA